MKTFKQLREQASRTQLTLSPGRLGLSSEGPGTFLPKARSREDIQSLRRIQSAGLGGVPREVSAANPANFNMKDYTPAKQQAFKTVDALSRETRRLTSDLKKREEELGQKAGALTNVIARSSIGDDQWDRAVSDMLGYRSDQPRLGTGTLRGKEVRIRPRGGDQVTVWDPENRGGFGTKVVFKPQPVDVEEFPDHPYFRVSGAHADTMIPTGDTYTRNADLISREDYFKQMVGAGKIFNTDGKTIVSDDVFAQMQKAARDAAVGDNEELNLMKAERDAAQARRDRAAELLGFGN